MTETIEARVQHKHMTSTEWRSSDIVLLKGEIGFETDTGYAKFGDGVSTFGALKYLWGPPGPEGPQGQKGDTGEVQFERLTEEQRQLLRGERGAEGPQGPPGERGLQGLQGQTGQRGETGQRGPVGPQGDRGEPGVQGPPGRDGQSVTTQVLTLSQYNSLPIKHNNVIYIIKSE